MPGPRQLLANLGLRLFRWEWLFLVAGLLFIAKSGNSLLTYSRFQQAALARYGPDHSTSSPATLSQADLRAPAPEHRVIGTVVVPRIGMAVAIVEGIDDASLGIAAGHMPGTAAFGRSGNAVVAAHRDLGFHPLRKVRLGDIIEINSDQPYRYRVDSIQIVDPEATQVLAASTDATLTLITCYPFGYIGTAPKRFVVRGTLLAKA